MWQHLFWFFGHPEVYIVALPFFGIATEILPVFSRKPLFGYKGLVAATIAIAGLSLTVWAHHMFTTGAVLLPFFSFMTFLIAVPTGVKFFNWVGTIWRGQITFEPAMLFILGFLVVFLFGGLTGVILASPPLDFAVSDSYFVVAHFHYVLFGTVVFCMFGGFYFWWPKWTGKMLDYRLGPVALLERVHRLQHDVPGAALAGPDGHAAPDRELPGPAAPGDDAERHLLDRLVHPRRVARSSSSTTSTRRGRRGEQVTADDPWGFANSLEWATSCPPPRHNFTSIPRIRSERPAFDLHYPHIRSGRDRHLEQAALDRSWVVKVEAYLFLGCATFFGGSDIVYWYFSHDPTGTTALALAVCLAFLTGFYVLFTGRRLPERPEDTPDGEIDEGVGELGFFSPHSWWPLFVGLAAAVAALGVAIGWWLFLIGALALLLVDHRVRLRVLPRPLRALTCMSCRPWRRALT